MLGLILGEKSEQSQTFDNKGERIPTTLINTTPCFLVDIKWPTKNSYMAIKLGFGQAKNVKKTIQGELTKAGIKTPLRFLRELRIDKLASKEIIDQIKFIEENNKKGLSFGDVKLFIGDEVKPALFFKQGDRIGVSGISKGKGFQGVVRRHHFKGGSKTHGQSDRMRAPGSIGQTTTPGRIMKGKRMAGRMGGERVTIKNLLVVNVLDNGIVVKGLVPGGKGGLLEVRKKN